MLLPTEPRYENSRKNADLSVVTKSKVKNQNEKHNAYKDSGEAFALNLQSDMSSPIVSEGFIQSYEIDVENNRIEYTENITPGFPTFNNRSSSKLVQNKPGHLKPERQEEQYLRMATAPVEAFLDSVLQSDDNNPKTLFN